MLLVSSNRAAGVSVLNPNVRSRPVVSGGTLRTDTGQIIRAGRVNGTNSTVAESSLVWERCRALGLNCMRYGITVGNTSMSTILGKIDRVVEAARNNRCYVMLGNPEFTPGTFEDNIATNRDKSKSIWQTWAPRYANEEHVFYEMLNEPERWGAYTNYLNASGVPTALTVALRDIFDTIRAAAPNTVILAPTAANIDASGGVVQYVKAIQAWESLGPIDWTLACWAFHGYNSTARMLINGKYTAAPGDAVTPAPDMGAAALAWLMARYPIICTETNWWMEAARSVLVDMLDVFEDVCGWSLMRYPQQPGGSSFSQELFPNPLDQKVAQLRTRGFTIPVE